MRKMFCHILIDNIPANDWCYKQVYKIYDSNHIFEIRNLRLVPLHCDSKTIARRHVNHFKTAYKKHYNISDKEYKIQVALGILPSIVIKKGLYRCQPV